MTAPNFSFAQSKCVIGSVAALLTRTLGLNEAHADGMRFSAAPPFIWTDESPSVAQRVADLISNTFGTVHKLGPGTFIGAPWCLLRHFKFQAEKEKRPQTAMLLVQLAQSISMVQTQIVPRLNETLAQFRFWSTNSFRPAR